MKLKFTLLAIALAFSNIIYAQNQIGDTVVVQTFTYGMTYGQPGAAIIRDSVFQFPSDTSVKYEKILMLYNMRCREGRVSTGSSRNLGCGEWDYSCNTYAHDSTRMDSSFATTYDYYIQNFSQPSFNYKKTPIFNLYRNIEKKTTINTTANETIKTYGTDSIASENPINIKKEVGKCQYLFTKHILDSIGFLPGNINGITLDLSSQAINIKNLKIKFISTSDSVMEASKLYLNGLQEVYNSQTALVNGLNKIMFYQPFVWDGTSNIVIEFSFSNNDTLASIPSFKSSVSNTKGLILSRNKYLNFSNPNYIESDNYKGINGNTSRTIEAWIKTTTKGQTIAFFGANATGEKWDFRLNDNGYLRVEVTGGAKVGSNNLADGKWHHVACVFQGTTVSNITLYVDGEIEPISENVNATVNTNTTQGINFNVSKGIHNRYFVGNIADVRVWNTNLSASTIKEWYRKSLDSSHQNYNNLQLNYALNDTSIIDLSINQRNAKIKGQILTESIKSEDLFMNIEETNLVPNIGFIHGDYNLTVVADTLYDSIPQTPYLVKHQQIHTNPGIVKNDDILTINSWYYWNADIFQKRYDENGLLIDSTQIAKDSTLTPQILNYTERFPQKFEIMSFVSPYGINLDLGMTGKTWVFDVTDYAPVLQGKKRLTIERGGQWQEEMDIKFLYIIGTPPRNVVDIQQVWPPDYISYTDIKSDKFFPNKKMLLNHNAKYFKTRSAITGHGQEGEFTPEEHYINVNNHKTSWNVWRKCGENPIYPQGGTWIYDRAGWCPGLPTDIKEIDITKYVNTIDSISIDYGINSLPTGTSKYIVNNQLVSYGEFNHNLDAAVIDIIKPSERVEYGRENFICDNPECIIQNLGRDTIKNFTLVYWVNNNSKKYTQQWTGVLAPLQKQNIVLEENGIDLFRGIKNEKNYFNVMVTQPNNSTDEYKYNDKYTSSFYIPDYLPNTFVIYYKSNNASAETSYKITDENGQTVFTSQAPVNNKIYRDTIHLGLGCYQLRIDDSGNDGISFWANSDGNGIFRIQKSNSNIVLKTVNPDFGSSYIYNFTIDYPLTDKEKQDAQVKSIKVYPNPAKDKINVYSEIKIEKIELINVMGETVKTIDNIDDNYYIEFNVNDITDGVYFVNIYLGNKKIVKKIVIHK